MSVTHMHTYVHTVHTRVYVMHTHIHKGLSTQLSASHANQGHGEKQLQTSADREAGPAIDPLLGGGHLLSHCDSEAG